jgi:hypothetical protein
MIPFFQGAAGGAPVVSQVFAAVRYTGSSGSQTVTTGINLSSLGGLVWLKNRDFSASHVLQDTIRGTAASAQLATNSTAAEAALSPQNLRVTSFGTTGFDLNGSASSTANDPVNSSGGSFHMSWSFARAARFFDVVTYTGNGSSLDVSHSLGVTPGMVIIKRRNATSAWVVGHRGSSNYWASETLRLNTSAAGVTNGEFNTWDASKIRVVDSGGSFGDVNTSGQTYVAYLFAHDTASDGIVQCGSYTGNGATGQTITLGWEPQFLLSKSTLNIDPWRLQDFARGFSTGSSNGVEIRPSESNAEFTGLNAPRPSATGFYVDNSTTGWNTLTEVYAYLAIRKP